MGILKILENSVDCLYDKIMHSQIKGPVFLNKNDKDIRLEMLNNLVDKVIDDQKCLVEQEKKLIEIGINGEQDVIYELSHSKENMLILHDITIEDSYKDSQIDFIVITKSAIFVLEAKKFIGDIMIDNDGTFIRILKNKFGKIVKKEAIYSPITQNNYHIDAIRDLLVSNNLIKNLPIYPLIVFANDSLIINKKQADENVKNIVIKRDKLNSTISKLMRSDDSLDYDISDNKMKEIAELLIASNEPRSYDYVAKLHLSLKQEVQKEIETITDINKTSENVLYEKLREYRYKKAKELNYKPYFIFSNLQLEELVNKKPRNKEEFLSILGFGETKFEQYGQEIIEIIKQDESNDSSNDDIISALKAYRIKQCNIEKVKPYMIFNNAEMEDLIDKNPKTKEELLKVKGFGQTKVDKYGDEILKILNNK